MYQIKNLRNVWTYYCGLIIDENKLHYVYIKDLNDLCVIRQKIRRIKTLLQILFAIF